MRLSETPTGKRWRNQFASMDQPVAQRLLDDLIVVSPTAFAVGMRRSIEAIVRSEPQAVALYPIWKIACLNDETDVSASPPVSALPTRISNASPCHRTQGLVESVFPLEPPTSGEDRQIPNPISGIAGSVGSAIHIIADLKKQFGGRVLDRPALRVLRAVKCKRIVLVDDCVGSGRRALRYLQAFYRHPTVKSWCSYPGLRFTIVCYAATRAGSRLIEDYRTDRDVARAHPAEVDTIHSLMAGRGFWSEGDRLALEDLCHRYAPRTSRARIPLGFGGSMSMVVFPHAIPNTSPPILWSSSKTWQGLFPTRAVPPKLLNEISSDQFVGHQSLPATLQRIGQLRLASGNWTRSTTPDYRRLIFLLAVVARGFRRMPRIADIMTETVASCRDLALDARRCGLLTAELHLTKEGLQELDYARAVRLSPWEPAAIDESSFYFPRTLRGSQGSI